MEICDEAQGKRFKVSFDEFEEEIEDYSASQGAKNSIGEA
jgi:hypothetical protein